MEHVWRQFTPEIAAAFVIGFCFLLEAGQYLGLYHGRFDPYDLVAHVEQRTDNIHMTPGALAIGCASYLKLILSKVVPSGFNTTRGQGRFSIRDGDLAHIAMGHHQLTSV